MKRNKLEEKKAKLDNIKLPKGCEIWKKSYIRANRLIKLVDSVKEIYEVSDKEIYFEKIDKLSGGVFLVFAVNLKNNKKYKLVIDY